MEPVGRLSAPPWAGDARALRIVSLLDAAGVAARFVGGAVRDAWLGSPVGDLDIATPLTPEEVIRRLVDGGVRALPTGLAHGTVTAVLDGLAVEVTTLRRDVATDGRRAVVAFTDDWTADAERRDFTFNAVYADPDGTLYDPTGGLADLGAGRVRFVGAAADRLAEDHLRLLRFLRFQARFGQVPPDPATLAALAAAVPATDRLAGERIQRETFGLLATADPAPAARIGREIGLWRRLWARPGDPDRLAATVAAEARAGLAPDPLARLFALADGADPVHLAERLRLSRRDADGLARLAAVWPELLAAELPTRGLVRRAGAVTARRAALVVGRADPAWLAATARDPDPPPLAAADLLARGLAPGPAIGHALAAATAWADASPTPPDRDACLAWLARWRDDAAGA